MALPGNYALGYLEEDNPLKAYFRFRPLFLHEDGGTTPLRSRNSNIRNDGFVASFPTKTKAATSRRACANWGGIACSTCASMRGQTTKSGPTKTSRRIKWKPTLILYIRM